MRRCSVIRLLSGVAGGAGLRCDGAAHDHHLTVSQNDFLGQGHFPDDVGRGAAGDGLADHRVLAGLGVGAQSVVACGAQLVGVHVERPVDRCETIVEDDLVLGLDELDVHSSSLAAARGVVQRAVELHPGRDLAQLAGAATSGEDVGVGGVLVLQRQRGARSRSNAERAHVEARPAGLEHDDVAIAQAVRCGGGDYRLGGVGYGSDSDVGAECGGNTGNGAGRRACDDSSFSGVIPRQLQPKKGNKKAA